MRSLVALAVLLASSVAHADDQGSPKASSEPRSEHGHEEAPIHGFTYSARGSSAGTVGGALFDLSVVGSVDAVHRYGARVFVAPMDRLTLIGETYRAFGGALAPSIAAIVRLYGGREGLQLGVLAKGKAEGFTGGRETEGEAEAGLLVGYHAARFHLDANAVAGVGLGDESEMDSEAKLRIGYDALSFLRVGIDGQARIRVFGDKRLAGNRTWDWVVGPQVLASYKNFYAALSAGPATFGYGAGGVGFLGSLALGATTL